MKANETTVFRPKSSRRFIEDVVDKIDYGDFQPPIDKGTLQAKLKDVFCNDSPYWNPVKLPASWEDNWFAVQPKTFERDMPVTWAITVGHKAVRIVVYFEIEGSDFYGKQCDVRIEFKDLWTNYSKLTERLLTLLEKSQEFARVFERNENFDWGV